MTWVSLLTLPIARRLGELNEISARHLGRGSQLLPACHCERSEAIQSLWRAIAADAARARNDSVYPNQGCRVEVGDEQVSMRPLPKMCFE
jgi:hypothetical protein